MGQLGDFENVSSLSKRNFPLRVEEVYTASTIAKVRIVVEGSAEINRCAKLLLNSRTIVRAENFGQYFQNSIGNEITLIRSMFEIAVSEGIMNQTQKKILDIHKAETKIKRFLLPHDCRKYDYRFSKNMIQEGLITEKSILPDTAQDVILEDDQNPDYDFKDYYYEGSESENDFESEESDHDHEDTDHDEEHGLADAIEEVHDRGSALNKNLDDDSVVTKKTLCTFGSMDLGKNMYMFCWEDHIKNIVSVLPKEECQQGDDKKMNLFIRLMGT